MKILKKIDRVGSTDLYVEYELVTPDGVKPKKDWFTISPGAGSDQINGALAHEEVRLQTLVDQGADIW